MRRCPRCTHPVFATDRYCLNCGQPLTPRRGRRPWLLACLLLLTCAAGAKAAGLSVASAGTAVHAPPSAEAASPPPMPVQSAASPTNPCRFVLGFQTLHALMPARIGGCRDNEQYAPASADAVQHTSGGLLVWRKSDNGTAFTDGSQTWVLGPSGLQQRPNGRRFRWEANPAHLPVLALILS